jgi:hypothetical protein
MVKSIVISQLIEKEKNEYLRGSKLDPGTKEMREEVEKLLPELIALKNNTDLTESQRNAQIRKLLPAFDYAKGKRMSSMIDRRPYTVHRASELRKLFTTESKSRLRFRGEWICYLYDDQTITQSYAAGFYEQILRRTRNRCVDVRTLATSTEKAKDVSDQAFRRRGLFDPDWRFYAHLSRLEDYNEEKDLEDFAETIQYWVTPKEKFVDHDPQKFIELFEEKLNEHVVSLPKIVTYQSVEDWLTHRTTWAGSGSSYTFAGHDFRLSERVDHTKWAYAWTSTDEELLEAFWDPSPAYHKVIQKREVGKVRAVISADMKTYLRMKYLHDVYVGNMYRNWQISPITMHKADQLKMWRRIALIDGVRMPVDQSEFDQQQLKICVLLAMAYWCYYSPDPRLMPVFEILLLSLVAAEVVMKAWDKLAQTFKVILFLYKNGVLSGWFWTALIDTVINFITAMMVLHLMKIQATMLFCQGDDDAFQFAKMIEAILAWACYVLLGMIVNPKKFYISQVNDEFLRKVVIHENGRPVVTGYPARSVTSILWANPVGDEEIEEETLVSARLAQWHLFSSRLNCDLFDLPIMKDLMGVSKLNAFQIREWLNSPRSLGGGGVEVSDYNYAFEVKYIPWPEHTIAPTQATQQYAQKLGTKVSLKAITKTLRTKPTKTEKEERSKMKTKLTTRSYKLMRPLGPTSGVINFTVLPDKITTVSRTIPEPLNPTDYTLIDEDERPELIDQYSVYETRYTRGFAAALVSGLKLHAPRIQRVSDDFVSSLYASLVKQTFYRTMNKLTHRISCGDWTRVSLGLEQRRLLLPTEYTVRE